MAQSYANPGGTGNRTATITVTSTAALGSGPITALVDGSQANQLWWATNQSGLEVRFDFSTPRLITEATWYQDVPGTQGAWQWQGSPDGSSWTNIGTTFTLGSTPTQVITTLSANVTSYRYYRILQTSGLTSSAPFLREVEFSIDAGATANTTWSTTDKNANWTLSGGNLIATSGTGQGGVRTTDRLSTGKYYFEITGTTWVSGGAIGVANGAAVLTSVASAPANACVMIQTGLVYLNGSASGMPTFGARSSGDVVCIALDHTSKQLWFRIGAAGNWNANASFAPGGTGGISLASISLDSRLLPLYGLAAATGSGLVFTANFGDSAFVGAVPSGYTSGFPQNTPPLYAAATQVVSEQWINARADARLTQIFLEHWGPAGTSQPMAVLTQIAIEEWFSLAAPTAGQARAWILA